MICSSGEIASSSTEAVDRISAAWAAALAAAVRMDARRQPLEGVPPGDGALAGTYQKPNPPVQPDPMGVKTGFQWGEALGSFSH
jgi:hypothetical protein